MSILTVIKTAAVVTAKFAVDHAELITSCVATIGIVSTAISGMKAGQRCHEVIKVAEKEKGDKLTFGEKTKKTWKIILPVGAAAVLSIAAVWTGQYAAGRRLKQACAFYSAALAAKDVQIEKLAENVTTEIAEKAKKEAKTEVAEAKAEQIASKYDSLPDENAHVLIFDPDGELWIDDLSGQLFRATHKRVMDAVKGVQREYGNKGLCKASEFYRRMGWPIEMRPLVAQHLLWIEDNNRHGRGWEPEPEVNARKTQNGTVYSYIDLSPGLEWDDGDAFPF